jgi:Prp8 binding protein
MAKAWQVLQQTSQYVFYFDQVLWNAFGEAKNYGLLKGHTSAVTQVVWTRDAAKLASCSADMTVSVWDALTGERIKKFKGHKSFVNSCAVTKRGQELVASASNDGTIKLWDTREKNPIKSFDCKYPMTCVSFSLDGSIIFCGGIDNQVKVFFYNLGIGLENRLVYL